MKVDVSFKSNKDIEKIDIKSYPDIDEFKVIIEYPEKMYSRNKIHFLLINTLIDNCFLDISLKNFDYENFVNLNFGENEIKKTKIQILKTKQLRNIANNRFDLLVELIKKPKFYEFLNAIPKRSYDNLLNSATKFTRDQTHMLITKTLDSVILYEYGEKQLAIARLQNTLDNIKRGRPIKYPINFKTGRKMCETTYAGFLKALRSKTLYIAPANIDGKKKLVFVKNTVGSEEPILGGIKMLFIDPETLCVYRFKTDKMGNIVNHKKILTPELHEFPLSIKNNKEIINIIYKHIESFKKELPEYLDKVYAKDGINGLKRLERLQKLKKIHKKKIEHKQKINKIKKAIVKIFRK